MLQIDKSVIKRILCIKLKGIGDVVLSTVVFKNLLKDLPGVSIDFLTEAPSKPLLETLPFINEVLVWKKEDALSFPKLIAKIMSRRYDVVLDFYSNPRTAVLTLLSLAKYRIGFPYRGRAYAYNIYGPKERDKYHAGQLHLEMIKNAGFSTSSRSLLIGITSDDERKAEEFFDEFIKVKPAFGISPSGGWDSKKCEAEKFAEFGNAVVKKYGIPAVVVWGPGDKEDAEKIVKLMNGNAHLAPPTTIREMAAFLKKCSFVIANDSGPMHIATAVKTPVLSLHGPTNPNMQGPFGELHEWVRLDELECIECNLLVCNRGHECFLNLTADRVLQKVDSLISQNHLNL